MKLPWLNRAAKEETFTLQDMEKFSNAELIENFNEMKTALIESHGGGMDIFASDDLGYIALTGDGQDNIPDKFRREMVQQSRVLAVTDAITKQSIRLYTGFGVGTGMNITIKGEDKANAEKASVKIQEFIKNPENKKLLSGTGQTDLSDKLLTDGEIFFVFFKGANGEVILRTVNAMQITDVATDLDDEETTRYFKRETAGRRGQGKSRTVFYRDWNNTKGKPGEWGDGETRKGMTGEEMFHVKLSGNSLRGYPLVTAQIRWSRAYRAFMVSRIAIQQALARTIERFKVKGGARAIEAVKNKIQSTLTGGGRNERNPGSAYGSADVHNRGVEVSTVKQETGAQAAKIDGAMIVSIAGAAVGIFPHYFGHGESFRLATATAMEGPMLKVFEQYRSKWKEVNEDIFRFVLTHNKIDHSALTFDINYPEIFPQALTDKIEAIAKAVEAFPGLSESEALAKLALDELGISDSDAVVNEVDLTIEAPETNTNVSPEVKAIQKEAHIMNKKLAKLTRNEDI